MTAPSNPEGQPQRGRLFIISSPSGGGKSSVLRRILAHNPDFFYSISVTTRERRPGESHGVNYLYTDQADFNEKIQKGDFLEYARVHGNFYGTLKAPIWEALSAGRACFLDIDVQGMDSILGTLEADNRLEEVVTIFILPPSEAILETRLRGRQTDSEENIQLRLKNAREEMRLAGKYMHTVVNHVLEDTVDRVADIIRQYGFTCQTGS